MQLSRPTFDRLRQLIHRYCGLVVGEDKEYLVHDRFAPLLRQHGWTSFEQLADRLGNPRNGELIDEAVEAIVTRETSFFRDPHVWESLRRELLPRLIAGRITAGPRVRVWSAAASTGQEAYTLAMLATEWADAKSDPRVTTDAFSILAADICPTAVQAGKAGIYESRELARGISETRRRRFFEPVEQQWQIREPLRRMVEFRRVNLAEALPRWGPFDLICCRNVLIYFDEATRRRICEQFHAQLSDGGWLLLGAAENLYGISDQFVSTALGDAVIYRKT